MSKPSAPKTSFPEWIQPMAATLTQERFTGPEWIFERKFDGIRLLAFKKGPEVRLFSRNHLPQEIPALAQAIAKLPHSELILDGEITWGGKLAYHVFDILWLDGRSVTTLPIEERRALLRDLPLSHALAQSRCARRRVAVGARAKGRLGGRGRETTRFSLRATPLAALVEDEMRAGPGVCCRWIHRPSGKTGRPGRSARWLLC